MLILKDSFNNLNNLIINIMEPNPNFSTKVEGRVLNNVSGFGLADARIGMHIYQTDGEGDNAPRVVGNAPFVVELKVNGEHYRTIEGIVGCTDPYDASDYNCLIEGLPPGEYTGTITDVLGADCRFDANWNAVAPPYKILNGEVNALNLAGVMVAFEFGKTTEYGYRVEFGQVNGAEFVHVSLKLSSGGYDNKSVLEPGTTYHYRVIATMPDGTVVNGMDMEFTTDPLLPLVRTLPPSDVHE